MSKGKFWIDRSLFSNDIFTAEKANDTSAWVDLIGLAAYKPTLIKIRDVRVQIQRAEIGHAIDFYAKKWKWSKGKVLRYFDHLESLDMIKRDSRRSTITTIISIVNYNKYQSNNTADGTTDESTNKIAGKAGDRPANSTQLKNYNKIKELEESGITDNNDCEDIKNSNHYDEFISIWNSHIKSATGRVIKLSAERKLKLDGRINSFKDYTESITTTFETLCNNISYSDFLNGKKRNGKPADWDWVMESDNRWLQILEGKYASYQEQKSPKQVNTPLMNKPTIRFGGN